MLNVDGYVIEHRSGFDRAWKLIQNGAFKTTDRIIGSFLVRSLQPNTKYQFRVRTKLADGSESPVSSSTKWLETPASSPADIVTNLRWKILDTSHLLLEWDPIEVFHTSGPNLRYNVTWTDSTNDIRHHYDIVSQPSHVIALKLEAKQKTRIDPEDCQVIAVGVQPLNDLGTGPAATDTVVYLSNNAPKRYVAGIKLEVYNATHLNISWNWVLAGECENVMGAQISCVQSNGKKNISVDESNSHFNITIPHHYNQWLIGGLRPLTGYQCSIIAFDQYGRRGRQSITSNMAMTAEPSPMDAPEITKVKLSETLSGYTTLLDWRSVKLKTLTNSSANERGYRVSHIFFNCILTKEIYQHKLLRM